MEGSSSSSSAVPGDGLSYYILHRNLLRRLVLEVKVHHVVAIGILSFWMWLESVGHPACIHRIADSPLGTIVVVVTQAEACLMAILMRGSDPLAVQAREKARAIAAEGPRDVVDLRYLFFFWNGAHTGLSYFMEQVHNQFFGELAGLTASKRILYDPLAFHESMMGFTPGGSVLGPYATNSMGGESSSGASSSSSSSSYQAFGRGGIFDLPRMQDRAGEDYAYSFIASRLRAALQPDETFLGGRITRAPDADRSLSHLFPSLSLSPPMHQPSNINPPAGAWMSFERFVPRDERTLFITFSNGYPLGERDLLNFFNGTYGGVETIHIQPAEGNAHPLFARVVFLQQEICFIVMNGQDKMKFMIKGRHVWVRHYIPKKKRKGPGCKKFTKIE